MVDKRRIQISESLFKQLDLFCFLNQIPKNVFVESLLKDFFKNNPMPKKILVKKDFSLKLTK